MFSNVLFPIDINHPASWEKAMPVARKLAEGGRLHVLGIVHELGPAMVSSFLPPDFEKQAIAQMQADLERFVATHLADGPGAVPHVGHGHVAETILRTAADLGADAIVMAAHPPDELRHLLVGSYAGKVVRNAVVPVMVVR